MLKHGERVQWTEGGAHQHVCTGHIICEDKHADGSNPNGFYTIRVDDDHRLRACHTAHELHMGWVSRSIQFSNLKALT